jgi:HAD superfamily hydrolase (TIGR01484 family)
MRYLCAVFDYDGTLATDSRVGASTIEALKKLRESGRKIILATGRQLEDLLGVLPDADLFDEIVAENGAVLYTPATRNYKVLAEPPAPSFVEELRRRGVAPIAVGDSIVATWRPLEQTVLDVIRDQGLGLQVIFNKDAVMVLPSGVSKATGLRTAAEELGLSLHNIVGAGDAENDHAFLSLCECSVAVANALPALKERADYVTSKDHGPGVEELIERILADDLASLTTRLGRHRLLLGHNDAGEEFRIEPYGARLMVAGPSGGGKSTTVSALLERLIESHYQVCLIDPEGDYDDFEQFVTLGGPERIPAAAEILEVLKKPESSLSVNLLGIPVEDRPSYFLSLLPSLQELQTRTGRPHWLVIDEAHHLLPAGSPVGSTIPQEFASLLLITVHPDHVSPAILEAINGLLVIGADPQAVIAQFSAGSGRPLLADAANGVGNGAGNPLGKIVAWMFGDGAKAQNVSVEPGKIELKRHRRKYAAGELGEDKSFYFRGAEGKLNLRAQNLQTFIQLAKGVDDETWLYHLKGGHYSQWFREAVKDQRVGEEINAIERDGGVNAADSRARIIDVIEKNYTEPA